MAVSSKKGATGSTKKSPGKKKVASKKSAPAKKKVAAKKGTVAKKKGRTSGQSGAKRSVSTAGKSRTASRKPSLTSPAAVHSLSGHSHPQEQASSKPGWDSELAGEAAGMAIRYSFALVALLLVVLNLK